MRKSVRRILGCAAVCAVSVGAEALRGVAVTGFEDNPAVHLGGEAIQPGSGVDVVPEAAFAGARGARLRYVFRETGDPRQYVELRIPCRIPGKARGVGARIRGDGSGEMLKLRITDGTGETLQYTGGPIDWNGWKEVAFDLSEKLESSWGGNEDRIPDSPLTVVSFLVDSPVKPRDGAIFVDDVTCDVDGAAADFLLVDVVTGVPGHAFYGQQPDLTVRITNGMANAIPDMPVRIEVAHARAAEFALSPWVEERRVSLPAGGSATVPLRPVLPEGAFGLYRVRVSPGDLPPRELSFSYLPDAAPRAPRPDSPFGVSMHFGGGGRGPIEANMKLCSDLGIRVVRDDGGWGNIEREKGVYAVSPTFDRFLRTARADWGLEPLIILDYSNSLYEKERSVATEEGRRAFAAWSEFMASTYRDSVRLWEVWNEPNIEGFWKPKPNPADYAALLKATYPAVKRGNPDAVVIAMVTAGVDYAFVESVLKEGTVGFFDAIAVHPYRYPRSPDAGETTADQMRRLNDLLAKYGAPGTPIYNSEVGWPNQDDPRGLAESVSADYLARMYISLHEVPEVRTTFWYDFQNDGLTREYNEHNFGLLRNDFSPKEPAVAYRMTSRMLEGGRYIRTLSTGPRVRALEFRTANDEVLVAAWAPDGTGSLDLFWDAATLTCTSAAGPVRELPVRGGTVVLELTGTPLFVTGPGAVRPADPGAELTELAGMVPGTSRSLLVRAGNPRQEDVQGPLMLLAGNPGDVVFSTVAHLGSGEALGMGMRFVMPADAEPGTSVPVRLRWVSDDGAVLAAAGGTIPVLAPGTLTIGSRREGGEASIVVSGTSPLPAAEAHAELTLTVEAPDREPETVRLPVRPVAGNIQLGSLQPPGSEFTVTVPAPPMATAASCAATLVFARLPQVPVEARRQVGLACVPEARIDVDGDRTDWAEVPEYANLTAFEKTGEGAPSGDADLSASVKVCRGRGALRLLVTVRDDIHRAEGPADGLWRGDGLQVAFDPTPGEPGADERFVEVGFALVDGKPVSWQWHPGAGEVSGADCRIRRTDGETVYEISLAEALIGRLPSPGRPVAFALVVNENDGDGREGWLSLFDGVGWRKDPALFGSLFD